MPQPGETISHYKVISAIGAGGMGEVFLAEDTKLDRQVALKVLLAEVAHDEERVKRFVQEAKAASALNHPNILTVFEVGSIDGSQYIATEFIRGITLRERMKGGGLGLTEALGIALQTAAALGAAHEAGIIHRDIKPENIMIRDDGLVKVLDFGLAKLTEKRVETSAPEDATKVHFNTQPGMVVGTVTYMSPEQARGHKLDARSDIFSLGIVMYELFAGKRPFHGESNVDLISSILKDDPPALRQMSPALPRQLERIVDRTLRKDRDSRYQHVKDLQIDLEDLRDELKFEAKLNKSVESTLAVTPQITNAGNLRSTLTTSLAATRRFTLLHAFLFGLIAFGVIGGLWFYYSRYTPPAVAGTFKATEVATWNSAPGEIYSNASFSPDGKMIAFASTKSGTKNIWITQTASTDAIQVTNDNFANTDPIWSAKGDELAFFSQRGADGKPGLTAIWRVPALGGAPKWVGNAADGSSELRRWAASGKIYYQSGGELHALDMANGTSQKVTSFVQNGIKAKWVGIAADEKSIAYVTQIDGNWQMFVGDNVGANAAKVADGTGEIKDVVWLPEKERIFYSASVDGVFQIFKADIGSGNSVRITSSETDSVVVDAAPDGKSIIFSSAKEESNLWRVMAGDGQESPVARDLNSKLWPALSPDNEKVAFQSVKNLSAGNQLLNSSIVVKPLKSRDDGDRLSLLAESGFLPTWSPDGAAVAFMRKNPDLSVDLIAVNPNGGGERRLTGGGIPIISYSVSPYNHTETRVFAWSPDSSKIAYVAERGGVANVWAVNTRDGSDSQLTSNNDPAYKFHCPVWSSDGKRIAFFAQRKSPTDERKTLRGLRVFDIESRNMAEVFETEKIIRLIGWTADEHSLIFAESENRSGLSPETILKSVEIASGAEKSIALLQNAYYYNIFLSDDRKLVAFAARNEDKDDVWVIPSAGGSARKLTKNNDSSSYFSRLAWLHDGSSIVFGKQTRFSLLSMITDIN